MAYYKGPVPSQKLCRIVMFVAWAGCELPPFQSPGPCLTDISLNENPPQPATLSARVETARRAGAGDARFRLTALLAALAVLAIFAGVITSLVIGAMPAFKAFGFGFIFTEAWSPTRGRFRALASIYGTLVTSLIAMVIAVPVGIGIAIFLTDLCPRPLRRPIGIAIELFAGIPSIIYGIWGLFIFAPWFQGNVQPWLIDVTTAIPILQDVFAGPPYGIGIFTAAL